MQTWLLTIIIAILPVITACSKTDTEVSVPEEETEEENVIFVNVKKVLLCVLAGAGILILFFVIRSMIQNYSFAGRKHYKARYNKKTRYRYKSRRNSQPSKYGDYD